jgi:hypothetical protein
MRYASLALPALLLTRGLSRGDSPNDADRTAIKQAALDYIEGWYEGNAERMERSVRPAARQWRSPGETL